MLERIVFAHRGCECGWKKRTGLVFGFVVREEMREEDPSIRFTETSSEAGGGVRLGEVEICG